MNRTEARDLLQTFVRDQWAIISLAHLGTEAAITYQGVLVDKPSVDKYWLHVDPQTITEDQETLRLNVRRFKTEGQIILELRAPIKSTTAQLNLDKLSEDLRNAFRTHENVNMQFTSARIWDNIKPEADYLRVNVISNFTYRQFI